MITVESSENISALEKQWKQAKQAERKWTEHRRLIEDRILQLLPQETFIDVLPDSGSVRMSELDVSFKQTRTFAQGPLAQVIAQFEWLLDSLFRVEYKVVRNPALDKFIASDDEQGVGKKLLACFEDKAARASFKAR